MHRTGVRLLHGRAKGLFRTVFLKAADEVLKPTGEISLLVALSFMCQLPGETLPPPSILKVTQNPTDPPRLPPAFFHFECEQIHFCHFRYYQSREHNCSSSFRRCYGLSNISRDLKFKTYKGDTLEEVKVDRLWWYL